SRAKRRAIAPPVASPAPITSAALACVMARLLQPRVGSRRENLARNIRDDGAGLLRLRTRLQPLLIAHERCPDALALAQVPPFQQVGQVLVALANHRRPEADGPETVFFPELQRHALEALVQVGQAARHAAVDAQFMNHGNLLPVGCHGLPSSLDIKLPTCPLRVFRRSCCLPLRTSSGRATGLPAGRCATRSTRCRSISGAGWSPPRRWRPLRYRGCAASGG